MNKAGPGYVLFKWRHSLSFEYEGYQHDLFCVLEKMLKPEGHQLRLLKSGQEIIRFIINSEPVQTYLGENTLI